MASRILTLHLVWVLTCQSWGSASPEPDPGRFPKVYNALITSNQNLEPSKSFPIYQPVLHDATFTFPFSPVFYEGFPSLLSAPALHAKDLGAAKPSLAPSETSSETPPSSPEVVASSPTPPELSPVPQATQSSTSSSLMISVSSTAIPGNAGNGPDASPSPSGPPPPPVTQSPIPLNEFGLPPHVKPLGRFNHAYHGFTHISPYTYTYPSYKYYDFYDPFTFNPFTSHSFIYSPSGDFQGQNSLVPNEQASQASTPVPSAQPSGTPPPEPRSLNELNYSADPSIPNVPPPPLPEGGLKSDPTK